MKDIRIKDILDITGGELLSGDPETEIVRLTTDSRSVPEQALFIPIVGERLDGHDYIDGALLNGAAAVLTQKREAVSQWNAAHPSDERCFILVADTAEAMQKIGKAARLKLHLPAVGVTGSVGKTTTREMIACALSAEKKVFKTDKNFNNRLGVPLTLSEMTDEDDIAVLELGLYVPGELGLISSLSDLDAAVITNIGVSHIEFYGTQDRIALEKFTITKGFCEGDPAEKMLFLNGDDPLLMKYKDTTGYPYTIYGTDPGSDYSAQDIRITDGRYSFDFCRKGEKMFRVSLSVPGEFNVLNAVGALAVADRYGVDLAAAAEKLEKYTGFRGRLQQIEHDGYLIIDDSYNASPASMKAGLDVLEKIPYRDNKGKRIAVLGDMFELGDFAPRFHHEVGEYLAGKKIQEVLLIGENADFIGKGAAEKGFTALILKMKDCEEAAAYLKSGLQAGDIVYLKASHGMGLQRITEGLLKDD